MRTPRLALFACLFVFLIATEWNVGSAAAQAATKPHIFQHPALSKDLIPDGVVAEPARGQCRAPVEWHGD